MARGSWWLGHFDHEQIFRAKGVWQQLPNSHLLVHTVGLRQVNVPVWTKLSHELSAAATRGDELILHVTGDRYGSEAPVSLGHRFGHGVPLGTHAQVVAGVLHVAACGGWQRSDRRAR